MTLSPTHPLPAETTVSSPSALSAVSLRTRKALLRSANWIQLAKFATVGASGYAVNLTIFALLVGWRLHYVLAATCSFLVAVTNNYAWNRVWTFRRQRGGFAYQGLRFLIVSSVAYGVNVLVLTVLVTVGLHKVPAQAVAIVVVTPVTFLGSKLWSFRVHAPSRRS